MKLRSQRSDIYLINNSCGNVLPIVLLFSTIGLIIVFTYISHQLIIAKPSLYSLSSVQALFNARSGIYKAFSSIINKSPFKDSGQTDSTLQLSFGDDMFSPTESDSQFSETPTELSLFTNDSFGNCEITLIPYGSFYELTSVGIFRNQKRKVIATIGGKVPALPDTVLFIYNTLPWEGTEPRGTRIMIESSQNSSAKSPLLESLLSDYDMMLQVFDTALLDPPLTISNTLEFNRLSDTINGSLLIDGNYMDIKWQEERKILILGDLQITGEVTIENVSFVVAGEIKLFNKTIVKNGSLFSKNRIFIGDYAQFSGDAIAIHSITVYNNASVVNKSTLVTTGITSSKSGDSTIAKNPSDSLKYSIFIEEHSSVDAVCIALGTPGAIRTGTETTIAGILWAQNAVCHQGSMSGLIRAGKMVDSQIPDLPVPPAPAPVIVSGNKMSGSLTQLSTIRDYRMPCFTDDLSIIGWREE